LPDAGIMSLMQADLQFHVAPVIADCTASDGSYSGSGGSGGALITDVVFESLQEDDSGKCECSWCWSARSCLECLLIVSQSCNNKNQAVLLTTNKSLLQKEVIV